MADNKEPSNEEIIQEIDADNEKQFLAGLKKKNKKFLIEGLTEIEKEKIAGHITKLYKEVLPKHNDLVDKMDDWDEVFRMERKEVIGADGDFPNYRSPMSTVTLEVIHAQLMNVFFTPKDIMRVLPTEEGDVSKVNNISTFGNWSATNELDIFHQVDRLFHNSSKNGEAPYMVHWVKEYGVEIKREIVRNPADPSQPMYDPDTKEPIFQEVEEQKLTYNGPKLEVFSRKDYIQPLNAKMDQTPEWEMRRVRKSFDQLLRMQLKGDTYPNVIDEIMGWGEEGDSEQEDYDGDKIPLGKWENEFIEFYGRLRIKLVKTDKEEDTEKEEELEDEFIGLIHIDSGTLIQLRQNKFPLKMRPIGIDYFVPDDEGRRAGLGVMEMMDSQQKSYDVLYNQFIFGTMQSNNPIVFETPLGNQRKEPTKLRHGYVFPVSNADSIKIIQMPAPDASLQVMLDLIRNWAQLLFGISDFAAGLESDIDPDAPAKKVEIVVAQGNVRMNMIVKRKNRTLSDIFKRWFLLYKANMPPNKFMRIVGTSEENPWEFKPVSLSDFALKSIPDFEMVGNILNMNKSFEANKAIAIYSLLVQNPFFIPQSQPGLQALHSLTKWLIDKLDDLGLSKFLPDAPGEQVQTPEEENARFLQGDFGTPASGEDHIKHLKVHQQMLLDPNVPDEIKQEFLVPHIKDTIKQMQEDNTQQILMQQVQQQTGGQGVPQGGQPQAQNVQPGGGQVPAGV